MSDFKEKLQYFKRLIEAHKRPEEKREDPPAKRPEIMLKSMEECFALIRELFSPREPRPNIIPSPRRSKFNPEKMRAGSPASSCDSMKSSRSMDFPFSFKRENLWSPEPGPIISSELGVESSPEKMREGSPASSWDSMKSSRSMDFPFSFKQSEKKREEPPAKRPEIMLKLLEKRFALIRKNLSSCGPGPNIFSRFGFSPEEEEADSPAPSCESIKSDRSKD